MKLISLSLRGFIGTYDNLKLDEVNIDFTQFGPGLIALVGGNGLGKSSVLENLHPYRRLVSRKPEGLQHHVRLRDSHRILRFEMGGHEYECKILIDAQTGKQEAYLTCDSEPLSDGKATTYDEAVERIFGSDDLFFRALFRAQNAPSFNEMSEAKLKELFAELLGQQVYGLYEERAKIYRNQMEIELEKTRSRIEALRSQGEDITALESQRAEIVSSIDQIDKEIVLARQSRDGAQASQRDAELALAQIEPKIARRGELTAKLIAYQQTVDQLASESEALQPRHAAELLPIEERITKLQRILGNVELIDKRIAELAQLRTEIEEHTANEAALRAATDEKARAEAERNRIVYEHSSKVTDAERRYNTALAETQRQTREHEAKLTRLRDQHANAVRDAGLLDTVPCREMDIAGTCALLANARDAEDLAGSLAGEIYKLENADSVTAEATAELQAAEMALTEAKDALATARLDADEAVALADENIGRCDYDANAHGITKSQITILESERWEALRIEADGAQESLVQANADLAAAKARHDADTARAAEHEATAQKTLADARAEALRLDGEISEEPTLRERIQRAVKDAADFETNISAAELSRRNYESGLARCDERIASAKKAAEEIEQLQADETRLRTEFEEWLFLVQACGKKGILPLELDAAGPRVSAIANDLLTGFGNGYQVEIVTQRTKADGDQTEAFEILVRRDGNGGDTTPLGMLSGGQRVWIEAALMLAIGIYLRQQSTYDVQTTFMDESDGALDSDRAHQYMDMVRACHKAAGIHHTILITHRQELLAFIPQQIRFTPGNIEIIN